MELCASLVSGQLDLIWIWSLLANGLPISGSKYDLLLPSQRDSRLLLITAILSRAIILAFPVL